MNVPMELVEKAVRGDREALAALVAGVQADVWRLMLSQLGNTADAEDATQETFRQAVASIRDLREPGAFAGWLYRIALDKARGVRASRASGEKTAAILAARASTSTGGESMSNIEAMELRDKVREAVGVLDRDLRETVDLRYGHDLSYAEIAQAMNVPEGTVGRRLNTAHQRLREALAGAGVVVTLAMLESELAAFPRPEIPERLSRAVRRMASEPGGVGSRPGNARQNSRFPGRRLAVAAALFIAVGVPVALRLRNRAAGPESGGSTFENREVAASPGNPAKGPEASDPARTDGRQDPAGPAAGEKARLAVLEGRVLATADGPAVPGARVRLARKVLNEHVVAAQAVSGADGTWRLEVEEGSYDLEADAPGYLGFELESRYRASREQMPGEAPVAQLQLSNGKTLRHDVILQTRLAPSVVLSGTVVDERGFPVAGATVRVQFHALVRTDAASGTEVQWGVGFRDNAGAVTTSDPRGRFEFPSVLGSGTVTLGTEREGLEPARTEVPMAGRDTDVTVTMKRPVAAGGAVVDETGAAVEGALVLIGSPAADGKRELRKTPSPTDMVGRFSVADAPADSVILVFAPGHGWTIRTLESAGGSNLRVELPGARDVFRGHIRDAEGRPLAGLTVKVTGFRGTVGDLKGNLAFPVANGGGRFSRSGDYCGELPAEWRPAPVRTDAEGAFEVPGLLLGNGFGITYEIERNGRPLKAASVDSAEPLEIVIK